MEAIELRIHIQNTKAHIDYKPTVVTLVPVTRTKTAAGGYKVEDQPARQPQTFRIIEQGASSTPPMVTLTDGKQRAADFVLLGMPDAAIAIDDHWNEGSREWRVGDIVRSNLYEVRALVVERGR